MHGSSLWLQKSFWFIMVIKMTSRRTDRPPARRVKPKTIQPLPAPAIEPDRSQEPVNLSVPPPGFYPSEFFSEVPSDLLRQPEPPPKPAAGSENQNQLVSHIAQRLLDAFGISPQSMDGLNIPDKQFRYITIMVALGYERLKGLFT